MLRVLTSSALSAFPTRPSAREGSEFGPEVPGLPRWDLEQCSAQGRCSLVAGEGLTGQVETGAGGPRTSMHDGVGERKRFSQAWPGLCFPWRKYMLVFPTQVSEKTQL